MPRANLKRKPRSRFTQPVWIIGIVVGVLTVTGMAMVVSERNANPAPAVQGDDAEKSNVKSAPVANKPTTPAKSPTTVVPAKPKAATAPPASADAAKTSASSTPAVRTGVVKGEVVTVTGCLVLDNQEYKLTKTEGIDAPKSRSWKSGFLTKRGANLEVVDASKSLRLVTHLGQRVTLTGAVNDRTIEAWSLAVAARSCE